MKRRILKLILFSIFLISQLSLNIASTEEVDKYSNDSSLILSQESVEDSTVDRENWMNSDSAITKYLIGVAEYNEGNVELAKVYFHEAWKSLEFKKNTANIQRIRALSDKYSPVKSAKVRFPKDYKVNVYYRDGWLSQPKDILFEDKYVYSFLAGSTYKLRVESESKQKKGNIGMKLIPVIVIMSWLIAR